MQQKMIISFFNVVIFAKWAHENGCEWGYTVISNAALGGHIKFAKWARGNGCQWGYGAISNASFTGHIEFVKWARENGCPE